MIDKREREMEKGEAEKEERTSMECWSGWPATARLNKPESETERTDARQDESDRAARRGGD